MDYIARTDGGQSVLELRQGVLADIPAAERAAWRSVIESHQPVSNTQVRGGPLLTVSSDGSAVSLVWQAIDMPTPMARMRLKEYAANARWVKQQAPLTMPDGTVIDASESSKAKVQQALSVLEKGWAAQIDFKADNGWIVVNLAGLTAVAQALVAREQALFTTEKAIAAAIDAGTVTSSVGVDGWVWP